MLLPIAVALLSLIAIVNSYHILKLYKYYDTIHCVVSNVLDCLLAALIKPSKSVSQDESGNDTSKEKNSEIGG